MNAISQWLAPDVLRNLGLALSHFVWQGAAIAALAAAALAVARKASARYTIGVAALTLMFAAPVITFFVLSDSGYGPDVRPTLALVAAGNVANLKVHQDPKAPPAEPTVPVDVSVMNWLVTVWFAGVLLFSLRTAGGFFVVARLRSRDAQPVGAELLALCRDLQQRLGISRVVR